MTMQIALCAAAVADDKPEEVHSKKMKKSTDEFDLKMIKNVDIAAEFGEAKAENQLSTDFALENNNEKEKALKKLVSKNLLVVLKSVRDKDATFGFDTGKIN